jgi:hypothetical protein
MLSEQRGVDKLWIIGHCGKMLSQYKIATV